MAVASAITRETREDRRIAEKGASMGVVLLRNKEGSAIGSGSIVDMMKSEHFPKCEKRLCLFTSNVFPDPPGKIGMDNYSFECDSNQKFSLGDVAKSTDCYQPTAGLVLIPVQPPKLSYVFSLKSTVFDSRRTFPTKYYNEESEWRSDKSCFIVGSFGSSKDSWIVERFTLNTSKDEQGQLDYALQDDDGAIFQSYDELKAVRSHLCPRGAVILEGKGEGQQATCIGVLNFSDDEIKNISPLFFTPASLTGKVQLYYPTSGSSGHSGGRSEVDTSLKGHSLQPPQAVSERSSLSSAPVVSGYDNHHQSVVSTGQQTSTHNQPTESENCVEGSTSDDQQWQKLYKEKTDECSQLKQQSEEKNEMIALLKDHNAELRIDMKKTEQENEVLHTEIEKLGDVRTENEKLFAENLQLRMRNIDLRNEWHTKSKEYHAQITELLERWDTESREMIAENEKLQRELHTKSKEWLAENRELLKENAKLRAENEELHAKLGEVPDKLKELLYPKVFGDDASSSEGSKDAKAEGLSGSSANNQEGLDGSCKEKPFLDPLSSDVTKLE